MMNHEEQLKLQAYLDGELSDKQHTEVSAWLARDEEAAALLAELRRTNDAMSGFEEGIKLPESREFYWSKIQRQIRAEEQAPAQGTGKLPLVVRLRRLLMPVTGLALVAVAALVATQSLVPETPSMMETSLADSGAMVYHDYSARATFVWLSYPAESEIAEPDDADTFD
jgi:anti-sigma factor RsiW